MDSELQHDPQQGAQDLNILHAKQLCFQRIDDCAAQKNSQSAAHAQAVEQMLHLWAKHSRVDARKGMSLDDRLRDHPDLKATIIGLLELIERKMAQALSSPNDHSDAKNTPAIVSKDDEDVDPEEFLIKQKWRSYKGNVWETVGTAIDMLIELTAIIRKSTVWNSGLPTHFHRPDDYFAGYAKVLVRNWFKDARRSLTDQLADSVFIRRRHMLYKMKHEEKIDCPNTGLTPVPAESTTAHLPTRETPLKMERPEQTTPRIRSSPSAAPIFADLTPSSTNSELDKNQLKQRRWKVVALSGITEGSVSIEETSFSYMYPKPPTLGEKQRYGTCPYCSVLLPASKLTKALWRKHLHEDLQPYVCISEKCRDPAQFFSDSKQWLQHMYKFHGRDWPQNVHMATWYCDREHDRLEFKSESELQEHLIHDHGSLGDAHVNALVRRSWGVGCREAYVCPLCESTPRNIIPLMSDEDKARTLFGHIDDHLKALALFSLPSLDADPTSDEQKSSSGAQPPTSVGSKADSTASSQGLAQVDADLEGSLTFDDDPHSLIEAIGDEATVNKERVSDVPSSLDATLEWKFVSSEQGAPELDPVLEDLRRGHEPSPHVTISLSQEITLKEQILSTSVESVFDYGRKHFYPNGITDSLITKESITRELQAESPSQAQSHEEVEGLVEFISVSAKKLFAITMLTEPSGHLLQQSMETFRDKGVTDLNLPLRQSWWEENWWHGASRSKGKRASIGNLVSRHRSKNDELWPLSRVEDFCLIQRRFLAPVFSQTGLIHDFEPRTILPFTEKGPGTYDSELQGVVMFRIHEKHIVQQTMDAGPPYYVAVEKSHKYHWTVAASSAWKDRVELLSRMNSLNHRHIVRFVAAFQRGLHDRCTMFEWASGGNLTHLWNTFNRPKLVPGFVKAAFRQLVGLTSAMNLVHDASLSHHSFHGDLMPENILWFNNDNYSELGTLKIGGWAFGEELERKHTSPGVQRFEAPEFSNDPRSSSTRSPLSDIWSMGCIMLEFLIWLMYGVDGLDKFNVASRCTTFFGKTKDENQNGRLVTTVHPVVLEWMDHMAADPACEVRATALGNLLELIRVRLLVVEVPQRPRLARSTTYFQLPSRHPYSVAGPSRQGSERCTSSELEQRMREISDESESETYWLAAQPGSPPSPENERGVGAGSFMPTYLSYGLIPFPAGFRL